MPGGVDCEGERGRVGVGGRRAGVVQGGVLRADPVPDGASHTLGAEEHTYSSRHLSEGLRDHPGKDSQRSLRAVQLVVPVAVVLCHEKGRNFSEIGTRPSAAERGDYPGRSGAAVYRGYRRAGGGEGVLHRIGPYGGLRPAIARRGVAGPHYVPDSLWGASVDRHANGIHEQRGDSAGRRIFHLPRRDSADYQSLRRRLQHERTGNAIRDGGRRLRSVSMEPGDTVVHLDTFRECPPGASSHESLRRDVLWQEALFLRPQPRHSRSHSTLWRKITG